MAKVKAIAEGLPYELDCLRCGHHWVRREAGLPEICPKCKRRTWNKPKKEDPSDPNHQTAAERRAVGNLVDLMRRGKPDQARALVKMIEAMAEALR